MLPSRIKDAVTDIETLIAVLNGRMPMRIGIDGVDGAGKSRLAVTVASELNMVAIELDEYVQKNKGGYAEFIDYPSVTTKITERSSLVLEGVCLLDVAERLGCRLDCLIYVKRLSSSGLWADEAQCDFPLGIEEAIRQSRRNTELVLAFEAQQEGRPYIPSAADESSLGEEIMRYHWKYRPHMIADIIFCRNDD